MTTPKILQVMAGAKHGGAETAFVDMCLALHEAGVKQEIATRANDNRVGRLRAAGLKVHCLPFGGAIDLYTTWKLKKIIADFQPRIVQSWMARASWKLPKSDGNHLNVSRLGGYYDLKYFRNTDYFETITPDIRDYLIKNGIAADRVRHINNFAETETVATQVRRSDLQTPEDAIVLLALSRLHDAKALDILIRAVAGLTPQNENVHVWLAGEGPKRSELEQLAQDLNIAGRIHFLGWRNDRAALLQACDICVFPSRYEPFGTVFVQAWANKVPVICSLSDGPRQFVSDMDDGLLFPIDDVDALKSAIQKLVADAGLRQSLVERGFARYQAEFTKEKTVAAYLSFYKEILRREEITR